MASPYDAIADIYDPWSRSVTEDIDYYVELAKASGGPVLELGVGTGRIAVPIAREGIPVVGVDSSAAMLEICRQRAEEAGVAELLDLRLGDLRDPPVEDPVQLVLSPFRSFLHLRSHKERLATFRRVHELLLPGGRFAFDVFAPSRDDVAETHARWIEREPGIYERADWNTRKRTLQLSVRGATGETTMSLAWLSAREWRRLLEKAGFCVEACYGWFDRRPYSSGEDQIFVASRA